MQEITFSFNGVELTGHPATGNEWKRFKSGTPVMQTAGRGGPVIRYFRVARPRGKRPQKRRIVEVSELS